MPPRTQAERRASTRKALLRAASEVFGDRGFAAATVEDIASGAGVSTGALYAHFDGKEDLFLAVFEELVAQELRDYREVFDSQSARDDLGQAGATHFMSRLREDPGYFPLFIEFWAYAIRNARLRPQFAQRFAAFRNAFADLVQAGAREFGLDLDREPAERLGTIINALGNGLALEHALDPAAVPDELLGFANRVFFKALAQAAADGEFGELVSERNAT